MSARATNGVFVFRQRGAASIAIAMLIMFILAAAVVSVLNISGSSVNDAAKNEEQVAALFLAESGVERAQATIIAAAKVGNTAYTQDICAIGAGKGLPSGPIDVGSRGSYQYIGATPNANPCGGTNATCLKCTVKVKGTIGASSRTIVTSFDTSFSDGSQGCGSNINFNLPVTPPGKAGVFANLAWRASGQQESSFCTITGSNSSAKPGTCAISLVSCDTAPCATTSCYLSAGVVSKGWELVDTGNFNASSEGIFATVPDSGVYTLDFSLVGPPGSTLSKRSYAGTAALFFPGDDTIAVGYKGAYSDSGETGGNSGLPTGKLIGTAKKDPWYCGGADMSFAASADTLLYGLSIMAGAANNKPTDVTLTSNSYPLYLLASINNEDFLHSQTWVTHNPAYYPSANATNGPDFTGKIGSVITGGINSATKILTLDSGTALAPLSLAPGSTIRNPISPYEVWGVIVSKASGSWGVATSTYNLNGAVAQAANTTMNISDVLTLVTINAASGVLAIGDTITDRATNQTVHGTLGDLGTGSLGVASSTYQFTNNLIIGNTYDMSSATTIHAASAAIPPSAGTVLAVATGTGAFGSATITASISGTVLKVTNGTPMVGDALYGSTVKPGTRITRKLLLADEYEVTPSQSSSGTMIARTAIRQPEPTDPTSGIPAPTVNSFVVSRKPTTAMTATSKAQLCGGVCPFLLPFTTASSKTYTPFSISSSGNPGGLSGASWSSGFACMNNVNPLTISFLGQASGARQSNWSEPVQ